MSCCLSQDSCETRPVLTVSFRLERGDQFESGFQQEVVTLAVFMVFAIFFLKEKLAWNYLVAFGFLGVSAFFAFAFKTP